MRAESKNPADDTPGARSVGRGWVALCAGSVAGSDSCATATAGDTTAQVETRATATIRATTAGPGLLLLAWLMTVIRCIPCGSVLRGGACRVPMKPACPSAGKYVLGFISIGQAGMLRVVHAGVDGV